MDLSLTTPALLFPTISLLLLAYTNRFIAIGNRIRALHELYRIAKNPTLLEQLKIFRLRIRLIRDLQIIGISSIFVCVLSMFLIFADLIRWAEYFFGSSLLLLMIAFGLAGWEIIISTKALRIQLKDIEEEENT